MQLYMIVALLIAILSAIFAVQNTAPITVNFLGFTFESSLAIVLLLTFAAGCLTSLCVSVPSMYLRMRRQRKAQAGSSQLDHVNEPTAESLSEDVAGDASEESAQD
jgi:lipopolysaccharide assembly protein A